jgi:predicted  nucleic acid-binding Zn-ribbon protein
MHKFDTKTALAKELNITRGTLYARAEKYDININQLNSVGLTDEELAQLSSDGNVELNNKSNKEFARLSAEIERLNKLNEELSNERTNAQTEATEYKEKFEALNKDFISSLKEANEKYYRLFDQSQILQLNGKTSKDEDVTLIDKDKTEQTPELEPKKGFWSRLFGN